jgi:myo-inositol-1(or 4)-monophosphatase
MGNNKSDFFKVAFDASQRAGEIINRNLGGLSEKDVVSKNASDYVTRVDRESEQVIIKTIQSAFPDHHYLAEETIQEALKREYLWIIDPLDGTTNFIHGYPQFSVSIALQYRGHIILGVIFDPLKKELFTAEKDKGAFQNKKPMRVSNTTIRESLITTGFPFRKKEFIDLYLNLFRNIFHKVSDIRRAGSAALDLAWLAAGRCDGFFEIGLSPWDIAAGSLIIEEAGGTISDFGGGGEFLSTGNIVAGTPHTHKEILNEVKTVFRGIINN